MSEMDGLTLDQLRTLIAVVDEGSFSAAGRRLQRVQSAVSHAMANLEQQVGVKLWDRSTRIPVLTSAGHVLLASARRVCGEVDALKQVAAGLSGGLEASVALAVDALLPVRAVVELCREFAARFPTVELRVHTETLSAVSALVLDGTCQLGVVGPAALTPGLERQHLATVQMVPVVSTSHALASWRGRIPTSELQRHVHLVLTERSPSRPTPDQAVLSERTWRIADLATKRALLLGGLGWGNLPHHMVARDLAAGRLVRIRPAAWAQNEWKLSLSVVWSPTLTRGPSTKWILERLPGLCSRATGVSV